MGSPQRATLENIDNNNNNHYENNDDNNDNDSNNNENANRCRRSCCSSGPGRSGSASSPAKVPYVGASHVGGFRSPLCRWICRVLEVPYADYLGAAALRRRGPALRRLRAPGRKIVNLKSDY